MSTLPPTPTFNANIPVITSAGGTSVAYKDPKSPESIMKKTTLLNAQTVVDTTYDIDLKALGAHHEGFCDYKSKDILYVFIILLLLTLFTQKKKSATIYIMFLASILLLLAIAPFSLLRV